MSWLNQYTLEYAGSWVPFRLTTGTSSEGVPSRGMDGRGARAGRSARGEGAVRAHDARTSSETREESNMLRLSLLAEDATLDGRTTRWRAG